MKFQCYTLGCKVNQYETQAMEQQLLALGHVSGTDADDCDTYLINTCTVTAVADRKNRTLIRRLRREHPQAVIGVCGCYAQVSAGEVEALGVDVVSGSGGREAFVQLVLDAVRQKKAGQNAGQQVLLDDAMRRRAFESLPAGSLGTRTRAMLKVQDGCCNFCTYCIIPYARGPVRSLPLAQAVEQARALEGYREVVLTGIEVASWGRDLKDGSTFADLVESVCRAVPQLRVRLGSLEPRVVDEDFCRRLAACPNFCPQFHLSLQSGSDGVLRRMHRHYDTARYLQSVRLLQQWFPGCAVTTDLIVGFPGETEEEFAESLAFARTCGLAMVHVFPYSRRAGTPAASMPGQLSRAEKADRSARAAAAAAELHREFLTAMCGTEQDVLFEQVEDGWFTGHAPNGMKVYARGEDLHNTVRRVRIEGLQEEGLWGEIL